ncbi:hypothetical protein WJX64_00025 [Leifsonia sp. YIM 134122]|uniref:Uncharacterized protein n=1 Tax=Leifsonia stereocauli TaxID=3134136 RepID=A0ABU9VYY9_9MICO
MCGNLTFRFNARVGGDSFAPSVTGPSATDVMRASRIQSTDRTLAPIGAIHWWDDGGDGHVGTDVAGGGARVFMASTAVSESLGSFIGFSSVDDYVRAKPSEVYQGWSTDYAGAPCPGLGELNAASVFMTPRTRGKRMYLEWDTQGVGYLVTQDGVLPLPNMQVYNLFRRVITSNQDTDSPDRFLRAEIDIMRSTLQLLALSSISATELSSPMLVDELSTSLGRPFDVEVVMPADDLAAAFKDTVSRLSTTMNANPLRRDPTL